MLSINYISIFKVNVSFKKRGPRVDSMSLSDWGRRRVRRHPGFWLGDLKDVIHLLRWAQRKGSKFGVKRMRSGQDVVNLRCCKERVQQTVALRAGVQEGELGHRLHPCIAAVALPCLFFVFFFAFSCLCHAYNRQHLLHMGMQVHTRTQTPHHCTITTTTSPLHLHTHSECTFC